MAHKHRRIMFVVLITLVSLFVGFICGRLEHDFRESLMQIFTVVPPMIEWGRILFERSV